MIKKVLGIAKRSVLNRISTPAIILLYHRVTDLKKDPQQLAVAPGNFYEQVRILKKECTLLDIEEFGQLARDRKKMPKKAAVITFDDGYADNYLEAIPILESLKAQALFYITTSKLDTSEELWWDELERLFLDGLETPSVIEIESGQNRLQFLAGTEQERISSYNRLHPLLKYSLPEIRDDMIRFIQQSLNVSGIGRQSHRLMAIKEVEAMSRSTAAVIGAHTHNHPALSTLNYQRQLYEISTSKEILEKIIKKKTDHFSYPYGTKKDYNSDSIKACREAGFSVVASNFYNQVHGWTDTFQLPRILVRNWEPVLFREKLSKFFRY